MASSSFQKRQARLDRLEAAVTTYVNKEKKRIEREVAVLEAVAKGRGWGDLNQPAINTVTEVAQYELKAFLDGT